jgi:hypothetical protein
MNLCTITVTASRTFSDLKYNGSGCAAEKIRICTSRSSYISMTSLHAWHVSGKWPNRAGDPNRSLFTHSRRRNHRTQTRESMVFLAAIARTGHTTLRLSITVTYVTCHHYHHHHSWVVGHEYRDIQISGISVIKISPFSLINSCLSSCYTAQCLLCLLLTVSAFVICVKLSNMHFSFHDCNFRHLWT